MTDRSDEGLRIMLEKLGMEQSPVSEELLVACYTILREHMYDREHDLSMAAIRHVVQEEARRLVERGRGVGDETD